MPGWPLFGLRLRCRGAELRLASETDLPRLVAIHPDDKERNPKSEMFACLDEEQNRARLICQTVWRALGTWATTEWCLHMAVVVNGTVVGIQSLEGTDFPTLRTVDSSSWLVPEVRGQGIGVAMRMAVLGLAFDHLGARAAITSARLDNAASLGVSRRIGYAPNGVSVVSAVDGPTELAHLRLTADVWHASGLGREVTVTGLEPCRPWFAC